MKSTSKRIEIAPKPNFVKSPNIESQSSEKYKIDAFNVIVII